MQPEQLYSVRDARRILCLGHTAIYELIGGGALAARKAGRKTLILGSSIDAFIASLPPAKIKQTRPAAGVAA